MIGTTLSHFKITAKLGEGGMGEVYRAEDTELERQVALKVLPEEMASDSDRLERFRREAKTVAALNHPNIVTIFSVAEADGIHFLTMELVEGRTLDTLTPPDGLSLERFFKLATPIADALASAHGRGIVHRDLKPANVMVTDEDQRVKVLDFGLAKLTEADISNGFTELPTEALTQEGLIIGTPHYMSPEQAKGEPVDQRSDIFSLGVMFYEMATGKRPFQGASSIELLSAVIKDTPPTVTETRPELPRHLGRVIGRCLEKAPADRYQTARDIYNELKALRKESTLGGVTRAAASPGSDTELRQASPEAPWIAVLPLKCQTADPDLEAFADGLTDDITTGLSRFSYLLVVSRNSTRKLEGQSIDARQAGQELGARYAVEGSLRKSGTRIRLSIQAVDARTGTHLWAETFDRNVSEADIFDVQDEITDRVVATIADPYGVLARSMAAPTAAKPPEELTAYEAVLRFFLYQQRVSAEDHLPTRTALERAVVLEPDNPDAWAALTIVLLDEDRHAFNPRPNALDRALRAAQRAVAADPANQLANYALATAHYYRREVGAFRSAAEHAIGLNRRDSNIMAILGILIGYAGDWDRGRELTTAAMELNPHHPGWYRFSTFFHTYHQKRYAEALAIVEKIHLPEYFATHYAMAIAQAQLGNLPEARAAIRECVRLWPEFERGILTGHLEKWMYAQPDLIDHIVEGLELAGLDVRGGGEVEETQVAAERSIAVLPFVNHGGNSEDDYFSDGLSEELINALSKLPGLRVTARGSSFQFRGQELDVREVGRTLGVETVLEGSVRIAGNRVRITADLVNCADGYQFWAERFDSEMKDIFDTQDEIARAIVEQLHVELGQENRRQLVDRGTDNLEAYHLLLKARHHMTEFLGPGFDAAHDCLEQAIELDPEYAQAYAVLSENYLLRSIFGGMPGQRAFPLVHSTALRALELDPELGEAHKGLAVFQAWHDFDWEDALTQVRLGIQKSPHGVWSHFYHAAILSTMRRGDEMVTAFLPALELDPLNPIIAAHYSLFLFYAGRNDEAEAEARKALKLFPDYWFHYYMLSYVAWKRRDADAAIANMEKASQLTGGDVPWLNCALAAMSFMFGRSEDGERWLAKVEILSQSTYVTPMGRAVVEMGRGNADEAIAWLERACAEHDTLFAWTRAFCEQQGLIGDERIRETMERLGLP